MLQPTASVAPVVVLDASVWLSSILRTDVNHPRAVAWINKHIHSGGSFVAPYLLMVEVAATVRRVTQQEPDARKALHDLLAFTYLRLLPMDQKLIEDAAEISILLSIKSGDSFYVAVAQQVGVPLVTFDQEQLARPAGIITTIIP